MRRKNNRFLITSIFQAGQQLLEIGLTGGIGSGKSTAAAAFVEQGAVLIDADQIVRDLQKPGEKVFEEMLSKWGPDILTSEGELDRQLVANIVFADPEELAALNMIVHPAVREEMTNRRQAFAETDNTVILEIPLLVESGYRNFDAIVVVDVDTDTAVKRLVKYRSFDEEDARNRLERQVSRESRTEIADYVIDNNNSMGEFNNEILKCWEWIKSIERPEIGRELPPLISKE
ncbi:MAG: dephospho-CoA kinase [Acidimicrobiaceae bacterium]|nr:dephospho-CoA kinase [Acidimicrobiaceae bacterium]